MSKIKNLNSIDEIHHALCNIEGEKEVPEIKAEVSWQGRKYKSETLDVFVLNDLAKQLLTVTKDVKPDEAINKKVCAIITKINNLDRAGDFALEKKNLFIVIITRIRQFFGNLGFNRKETLRIIDKQFYVTVSNRVKLEMALEKAPEEKIENKIVDDLNKDAEKQGEGNHQPKEQANVSKVFVKKEDIALRLEHKGIAALDLDYKKKVVSKPESRSNASSLLDLPIKNVKKSTVKDEDDKKPTDHPGVEIQPALDQDLKKDEKIVPQPDQNPIVEEKNQETEKQNLAKELEKIEKSTQELLMQGMPSPKESRTNEIPEDKDKKESSTEETPKIQAEQDNDVSLIPSPEEQVSIAQEPPKDPIVEKTKVEVLPQDDPRIKAVYNEITIAYDKLNKDVLKLEIDGVHSLVTAYNKQATLSRKNGKVLGQIFADNGEEVKTKASKLGKEIEEAHNESFAQYQKVVTEQMKFADYEAEKPYREFFELLKDDPFHILTLCLVANNDAINTFLHDNFVWPTEESKNLFMSLYNMKPIMEEMQKMLQGNNAKS